MPLESLAGERMIGTVLIQVVTAHDNREIMISPIIHSICQMALHKLESTDQQCQLLTLSAKRVTVAGDLELKDVTRKPIYKYGTADDWAVSQNYRVQTFKISLLPKEDVGIQN